MTRPTTEGNDATVMVSVLFQVRPGSAPAFLSEWRGGFLPAISDRPGFVACDLYEEWIRPSDEPQELPRYRMDIIFASEDQRTAWAATSEHQLAYTRLWGHATGTTSMRLKPVMPHSRFTS